LTKHSAELLFGNRFGTENVTVTSFGNVFAATCFIQGLAVEDVDPAKLDKTNDRYPVIVAIRATRED
jgi:hypothetical protein